MQLNVNFDKHLNKTRFLSVRPNTHVGVTRVAKYKFLVDKENVSKTEEGAEVMGA